MTSARALTRVRQELADAHPRAAVRRLRTMLATDPCNLDIYHMLHEINRSSGDVAEAGRWGYITGDATDAEIEAFERAHPQPWVRLQLVGWPGAVEDLEDPTARQRLIALQHQVTESTVPLPRQEPGGGHRVTAALSAYRERVMIPRQRGDRIPSAAPGTGALPGASATGNPDAGTTFPGRGAEPGQPGSTAAATSVSWRSRLARAVWSIRVPSGEMAQPSALKNYLILLSLIVAGTLGSVGTVAGLRALFGISNSADPVKNLIKAIVNVF